MRTRGAIVYRQLDTGRNEPDLEVAEILAELEGKETTDISTLYDRIDQLVKHLCSDPLSDDAQAQVQFHYEGDQITVHQHGGATSLKLT